MLAGCVSAEPQVEGCRVDLLGCRVIDEPETGAKLIKALYELTAVPFAAADASLGDFMLATFMEVCE